MNKFSDFKNSNLDNFINDNQHKLNKIKQEQPEKIQSINEILNNYSNLNQQQLFNEFIKVANEKKQNGTLTLEYINSIKNTLFPYLTEEQKQMFYNLVKYIS